MPRIRSERSRIRPLAACGESRSSARARNLGANLGQEPEANPRFVEDSWTPSRSQRTDRSQSNFHHRLFVITVLAASLIAALSPVRALETVAKKPSNAKTERPISADAHWVGSDSRTVHGSTGLLSGLYTGSNIVIDGLAGTTGDHSLASISSQPVGNQGFLRTFNVPVGRFYSLLYASPATGTVVGAYFSGSMDTHADDMDAADAKFTLFDAGRGIGWSVTGEDLGWSGQGTFGPSKTGVTHLFDGPLELGTDVFHFWESLNQSPGVGCVGCTADYDGDFVITVQYPSPVALRASFAIEGPDSTGYAPRSVAYSHTASPTFTVDYVYEESLGYWSEQPNLPCFDGDVNPTNFYLGIFNLTGKPVQACTFQASWDTQQQTCSQAILDVLNHPNSDRSLLIRTEDFAYAPDPACLQFSPTTVHVLPGVQHSMWVEFIIDGVSYERRMDFVKE